jgi:putative intracellular protease/amidase
MNILIVLTSHDTLGNTGRKTGFWLEELAAPYYALKEAGANIVLASPAGGQPPLDPKSDDASAQTDDTRRFKADAAANAQLAATVRLDSVSQGDFDAVFYPGGHGPLWDLAEDRNSIALIESFIADGTPLVQGKRVTGFTNTEEAAVELTDIVPFLVEDELKAKGGNYSRTDDWGSYVVTDGLLITGQNPGSSAATATKLLEALSRAA